MYSVQPVVAFQWMVGRAWSGRDQPGRHDEGERDPVLAAGRRVGCLVPQRFDECDELALVETSECRVLGVEVGLELSVELGCGHGSPLGTVLVAEVQRGATVTRSRVCSIVVAQVRVGVAVLVASASLAGGAGSGALSSIRDPLMRVTSS